MPFKETYSKILTYLSGALPFRMGDVSAPLLFNFPVEYDIKKAKEDFCFPNPFILQYLLLLFMYQSPVKYACFIKIFE